MSVKRKYYFIVGLYAVSFIVCAAGIYFLLSEIKKNTEEYRSLSSGAINLEMERKILKENEKAISQIGGDVEYIKAAYLKEPEIPGFIETLERVAYSMGGKFKIEYVPSAAAAPSDKKAKEEEKKGLNFKISFGSSFNNFLKFAASIEDNPFPPYRLVEITNLEVRKLEAGELVGKKELVGLSEGNVFGTIFIKIYTN